MNIERKYITIRELVKNYEDNGEGGVFGYDKKLNIRPPYQREFVYDVDKRNAVIDTVKQGFPLNTMYWAVRDDGGYEIIDGQQRTVSICQYVIGDFSIDNGIYFHSLQSQEEKDKILDYKLMVYFCEGTTSERLKWFEIINIAGETLTPQELKNATFSGTWVSDAKKYFCKQGGPAYQKGKDYVSGRANRAEILETAIKWIKSDNQTIREYMGTNQHNDNAEEIWKYFGDIIDWIESVFTKQRSAMKTVDWGALYKEFKDKSFDTNKIEEETSKLILDDDVTKNNGIYPYILTRDEKYLKIRAFSPKQKQKAYEQQDGKCVHCTEHFEITKMEGDHILPWKDGGATDQKNCQMLCITCNRS